ncbi:helix-turn-helix transcriptional regulator [Kitasatospora sp. NBC_01287]|uniref:helix-turn-helix domain-containing protein n=1 Tax=Kitasatospora sp. NBC_01287 TaxID=2903573 RepID=UPI00225527EA|nr:helix-turn-helix transcriptional regulator [Kitasatospora sp. NBC_01287]MCX4750358.1 helix-turn-helix transcriptional regulator [Kitasatospora sp. NBC_01287]
MSTDFQQARAALGARMRELREESAQPDGRRLSGRALAARLGWTQSRVSKLENGKQTPTMADVRAWAEAVGRPEAAAELAGRLRTVETQYRSWRRQLAGGVVPVQEAHAAQGKRTSVRRSFDPTLIPGLLQTAGYARGVLARYTVVHPSIRDVDAAVSARMGRQQVLRDRARSFHFLVWEGALVSRLCPQAALADQLESLVPWLAPGHVRLGVVPFDAELTVPAGVGFSIHDDSLVITESWHAEMWLDDPADVALHQRAWDALQRCAVYGVEAHRVIARAGARLRENH